MTENIVFMIVRQQSWNWYKRVSNSIKCDWLLLRESHTLHVLLVTDPSKAQRFSVIWQQTTGHGNIGNNRGQSDTGILENVYTHHIKTYLITLRKHYIKYNDVMMTTTMNFNADESRLWYVQINSRQTNDFHDLHTNMFAVSCLF